MRVDLFGYGKGRKRHGKIEVQSKANREEDNSMNREEKKRITKSKSSMKIESKRSLYILFEIEVSPCIISTKNKSHVVLCE